MGGGSTVLKPLSRKEKEVKNLIHSFSSITPAQQNLKRLTEYPTTLLAKILSHAPERKDLLSAMKRLSGFFLLGLFFFFVFLSVFGLNGSTCLF